MVGDGAMQAKGMAELTTIKRYRQEWEDQPVIVCVLHNNALNQVTRKEGLAAQKPMRLNVYVDPPQGPLVPLMIGEGTESSQTDETERSGLGA
jgi:thiamine pyrophosphate-dependent acetolactate synthase large subunit-like protein